MASNFSARPQHLRAMCAHGLIPNATRLITPGASQLGPSTYHGLIRRIGAAAEGRRTSPGAAAQRHGRDPEDGPRRLQGARDVRGVAGLVVSTDQLLEVTTLANQLLPAIRPESGARKRPSPRERAAPKRLAPARRRFGRRRRPGDRRGGVALETVLRDEPGLPREYGANLTASLMQVTTSSAGTNVKLQCLSALAKFPHHARRRCSPRATPR